jgi:hypothetical protein
MGKLLFNKAKKSINTGKNCIETAMPVAKHTAEYALKCCLEGILSA